MVVSWRALSEHQFFHGTDRHFPVGEVISPAGESGGVNYPNTTDRRYAIMQACSEYLLGLNNRAQPVGCTWD